VEYLLRWNGFLKSAFLLIALIFFSRLVVNYGLLRQVNNVGYRQSPITNGALSTFGTVIIKNDTTWYGDFIINETDSVIIANSTLTIVEGGVVCYGNLTVRNATINVERGTWAYTDFIFYGNSNLVSKEATLKSDNDIWFRDSSNAIINDSTIDIFIIEFWDNSIGKIYNTTIAYGIKANGFSRVDAFNIITLNPTPETSPRWGSVGASESAQLNVYNMSVSWSWIYHSSRVNLSNVRIDWVHVEGAPVVNVFNTTVYEVLDVFPRRPVVNVYRSVVVRLRMRWDGYDVREVNGEVYLSNSYVEWMSQYLRFHGQVTMNETGVYGEYWQAVHLTNATVDVIRPVAVCINETESKIISVDLAWLYLYNKSRVWLWNATYERLYLYSYQGFLVGNYTTKSLWGRVIGNMTIDATQQANTTLEMKTQGWVTFTISEAESPGNPPSGMISTGTYVNITASGNFTAMAKIHYSDRELGLRRINEETLKIYHWNGTEWLPSQITGVNTAENYVWANLTHFTIYTAIGAPLHDVAVTNITVSSTYVKRGEPLYINVTIENQGNFTETFNVTVYADRITQDVHIVIGTQNLSLTNGTTATVTFVWNTTETPIGSYYISAEASVVQYEYDTADNVLIAGAYIGGIFPPWRQPQVDLFSKFSPIALTMLILAALD
jgi:hypothetical protein